LQRLLNIAVYFPQCRVSSTGRSRYTAFFPGYIFAQIDLHKVSLSQINTIPGVLHIVSFGGAPSPIPHRIVQEIAQRVQYLDQFPHAKFSPGDPVRFKQDGALQDLEMMFVGPTEASQRVRVLLTLLGRQKEISVDIAALEKLPANPVYRRKRYTRGKGRRIKYSS
ncbi:MAG TPA: transcription termination/antitermination NusG family protein, partial [Ktedonobacteraceae bacterium]|nr:transcription termination/antitermination NusG family protein [Ktedonobacteraceae bacterium]